MTSQPQPPARPWKKGDQTDYSALIIEVEVCRDKQGMVFSSHRLQGVEDRQVAMSWPTGGLEQVCFALLVEAVRREALLGIITVMSGEPEVLQRLARLS